MLKQTYQKDFLISVAVNPDIVSGRDSIGSKIVVTQFNSITAENVLKWGHIHPEPNQYNFKLADEFIDFGIKNGMFILGLTLVWHSQTPSWVFQDRSEKPASRDTLLSRMREQDGCGPVPGPHSGMGCCK